jgi:two-component system, OmpR family, sensor histidine kinase RstB
MRRLYHKIYLVFLASLLTVVVIVGLFWRLGQFDSPYGHVLELAGELAMALLPPADAPPRAQQQAVERLSQRLHADIGLFDANLAPLAAAGRPVPRPERMNSSGGWLRGQGPPAWSFRLPDQRWIVARGPARIPNPISGAVIFLVFMAVAIAVFAYPVVRGLTKRIERLQAGVETLGAGNLATRVAIGGRDEVARLAASFNRAAARIEELVGAHRLLLANASHELRTPLSRLRLGIELYGDKPNATTKAELERDIAELDDLIEEILLASRLDVTATPPAMEHLDLLALVAEECAHYDDCTLDGVPISLSGDPRLLRRLVRNLLENAARHGKPPVRVELRRDGGDAILRVIDSGCGIPEAERERVFLPFFQLAGDRKGTGLGLSLVRQIARLHGGEAAAASRPDAPSCILIKIPIR